MAKVRHGTDVQYRLGCRCRRCRADHATNERARKRAGDDIPDESRTQILEQIEAGCTPAQVTTATGYTWQKIHGVASWDGPWSQELDDALRAGRNPTIPHGRYRSYRHHGCRCPDCRQSRREVERRYRS